MQKQFYGQALLLAGVAMVALGTASPAAANSAPFVWGAVRSTDFFKPERAAKPKKAKRAKSKPSRTVREEFAIEPVPSRPATVPAMETIRIGEPPRVRQTSRPPETTGVSSNIYREELRPATPVKPRKSKKAVTGDVLSQLLSACSGERQVDLRDRALLVVAFASGGRRRSEVAALRVENLHDEDPVPFDPKDPNSTPLPCLTIHLGRTKTTDAGDDPSVVLLGRPVVALKKWLEAASIQTGPIFRKIDQWGNIDRRAITPQTVNLVVKTRAKQAGLDPTMFSAHGLRSGYLTEAANRGVPLPEAMQQSLHKSVTQAAGYYNDSERKLGRAARLMT